MRFSVRAATIATLSGLALSPLLAATPAYAGISYDVAVSKSHTGNFTVGQNGTFTITLHNNGPSSTGSNNAFTVTDTLPNGLTYVSDTGTTNGFTCNANGQTVTCTGTPNLADGADVSFTITVSVGNAARPSAVNTVAYSDAQEIDTNADNNGDTDTVTVNAAAGSPSPSPTSPAPTHSPTPGPSASVAGETEQLPTTGGSTGLFIVIAVGLLVVGTIGYSVARTSRRAH